jgi:RND family efflux transporter MFP subunit
MSLRNSLFALIAAMMLSGCAKHSAGAEASSSTTQAEVSLVHPEWQIFENSIEQPGWIKAWERAALYTKINGYVEKVNVEVGSRVRKGDLLAVLWVPELDEGLKRKEALVEQARIDIVQADKALAVARANVETAKSMVKESRASLKYAQAFHERWKSEYTRMDKLATSLVVDKQVRDEILNQFKSAEAGVELAEAKIQSAEANQTESAAKIAKADADLKAAQNRLIVAQADYRSETAILEYAKIRAPFDGVVVDRLVDPGHLMQPGGFGNATNDDPMFIVCRMDMVRIFLDVPEADAVSVRDGAEATVRIQALKEKEFKGKVAGTSWALESKQRTLRVEIDFPNPTGELRPGMYAYARIRAQDNKVLAVPAAAIESRDGAHFCFLVENGKAVRTPIKVGTRQGSCVEVIQKQTKPAGTLVPRWEGLNGTEWLPASYPSQWIDGQAINAAEGK